jgi:hypothetical protein
MEHYQQDFSEPWECQPDDPRINDIDTEETDTF